MDLGLTGRQARVYLSLLKAGCDTKVQEVADASVVHRQDTYRVLDSLQQIGLVQRNVSAPTTYTVTPITDAVKLLLQQKTSELSIICQKAKQLTRKLSQSNSQILTAIELNPTFGTVSEADRGKKYRQALQNTQNIIEAVTSWNRFKQLSIHFEKQLQDALKKGAIINILTEKPLNYHLPKWIKTAQSRSPNFKLKTQLNMPVAAVTIFDQKTAAIAYNPRTSLTKGPDLWTNNPTLVSISQAYFNIVWTQNKTIF